MNCRGLSSFVARGGFGERWSPRQPPEAVARAAWETRAMTPAVTPASPTSSSTPRRRDGPARRSPTRSLTPKPIDRPSRYLASNRNVDILFLVDDSSSMRLSQDNLQRNFPVLMQALKNQPGGLPNIHIAVISSDMGAGDGSVAGCDSTGGKNGIFQYTPRGTCAATGLLPGATYISDIGGVEELHRQSGGRVHLHRRARRDRDAVSSTSSPRSRARSASTASGRARRERGLPAPRRVSSRSS